MPEESNIAPEKNWGSRADWRGLIGYSKLGRSRASGTGAGLSCTKEILRLAWGELYCPGEKLGVAELTGAHL